MVNPATRAEADAIATSGLLDEQWYRCHYPDISDTDPCLHFCQVGWIERRQPNPWFDTAWYLEQSPDVVAAGLNPLLHYIRHGEQEGRRPAPDFDPVWYRTAYAPPLDTSPLRHFLASLAAGQCAPDWWLYAVAHLPAYRDLAATGQDRFSRYLTDMRQLGRDVFPDPEIVTESKLVDANYYLINGSDVHAAGDDPAQHFCRYGWREARRPNLYFDTAWYLRTNPDVARLQINPLLHYILQGEAANRRPVVYFDPAWYRATYAVGPGQNALAHFLAHRRSQTVSPTPLFDVDWYVARYAARVGPNRDPFAHYLHFGAAENIDPSPGFDAMTYRRQHFGRPSRQFRGLPRAGGHNPLVHSLHGQYR